MNKKSMIMLIAIILIIVLIGLVLFGVFQKFGVKRENPTATITIEGYETPIVIELYPDVAPNTVKNFITLANNGFYDGLIIHRVEKNFVIQGGDPKGDGTGGPNASAIDTSIEKDSEADYEYSIVGEFSKNGYKNDISHERGVVSMARTSYTTELLEEGYNSGGSQFFICLNDAPSLNGLYAAFGRVISGMEETVDKIAEVKLKVDVAEDGTETKTSKPETDVKISSVKIDTKGLDYGKPEISKAFDLTSWYMSRYYNQ